MTARERLADLERKFNARGSTMTLETYVARYEELLSLAAVERAQPAPGPEAAPASAPTAAAPAVARKPLMTAEKTAELARLRRSFEDAQARHDAEAMLAAAEGIGERETDECLDLCAEKFQGLQARQVFAHVLHLASHFTRQLKIHATRREALEKRIAELEARPAMKYRGVHDGGVSDYAAGDVVTCKGTLWFCLQATKAKPGESSAWKMMHKDSAR